MQRRFMYFWSKKKNFLQQLEFVLELLKLDFFTVSSLSFLREFVLLILYKKKHCFILKKNAYY